MLFEIAARNRLRFETEKGLISAEDLWDLPLTSERAVNLDAIARRLSRALKNSAEVESFVVKASKADELLKLKLDVVKRVIEVRLAENEANALKRANDEKKEKLLELIAKKKEGAIEALPLEELEKMAAAL